MHTAIFTGRGVFWGQPYITIFKTFGLLFENIHPANVCIKTKCFYTQTVSYDLFTMNTIEEKQFLMAVKNGDLNEVQRFIASDPPQFEIEETGHWAATTGQEKCIALLLIASRGIAPNSALQAAARGGYAQCVKRLISASNPLHARSAALHAAVVNGHAECVDLLLPVSDSAEVLRRLRDQYPRNPELFNALADAVAQQQKQVLENAIERFAAPVCVRKM